MLLFLWFFLVQFLFSSFPRSVLAIPLASFCKPSLVVLMSLSISLNIKSVLFRMIPFPFSVFRKFLFAMRCVVFGIVCRMLLVPLLYSSVFVAFYGIFNLADSRSRSRAFSD